MMDLPSISIIIPTYNSEKVLPLCLESVKGQDYPEELIEIIIVDAGSVDRTIEIAREYYVDEILSNNLKTGEAGKAVGVKAAKNEIIALIDSDNIMDRTDWLKLMVEPFKDVGIVGTEPLYYTYRKEDMYITRYCALLGMNDPLCLFLGNYDRYCILTGKWTDVPVESEDKGDYLEVQLYEKKLPTIGANGFLVRRSELIKCDIEDYLFDIDVVYQLVRMGNKKFGKVKIGIVHIFSGGIEAFMRKQSRRIKDYLYYDKIKLRKYPWHNVNKFKVLKFILSTGLILPLVFQSFKGYSRKRDVKVWSFHIFACWVTLWIYGTVAMKSRLFRVGIENRDNWAG